MTAVTSVPHRSICLGPVYMLLDVVDYDGNRESYTPGSRRLHYGVALDAA